MDNLGSLRHVAVIEYPDLPVVDFYRSLGFEQLIVEEHPTIAYIDALSDGALGEIRISKYANAHGSVLEIITCLNRDSERVEPWNHFAVTVADCDESVTIWVGLGGRVVGGPLKSDSGPFRVAYVRDPSGNLVELVQHLC